MTWFKVDDGFAFHPKAVTAGNAALGLWVRAGSWSSQQLTDGFVPTAIVPLLGTVKDARALVACGLWDAVDGGYLFHEWAERNPSKDEVEEQRGKARDRMRKLRSGEQGPSSSRSVRANTERTSREVRDPSVRDPRPDPTRPNPTDKVKDTVTGPPSMALVPAGPTAPRSPNEFDTWWSAYPKKVGKDGARRAYTSARRRTTAAELLDGARRYADDPTRDPGFTANPQTWLNAGRWADEGPTRPASTSNTRPSTTDSRVLQAHEAGQRVLARRAAQAQADVQAVNGPSPLALTIGQVL